jgi:hypothetical protein
MCRKVRMKKTNYATTEVSHHADRSSPFASDKP